MIESPCQECIVQPMCKDVCDELEEYMDDLVPTYLKDEDSIRLATSWLKASAHDERINDVKLVFDSSLGRSMYLEAHPLVYMLIVKGRIKEMWYNIPKNEDRYRYGFNIYRYTKPGFKVTIAHTGMRLPRGRGGMYAGY